MIKPRRHWLITPFFSRYIGYIIKRHFYSVNFDRVELHPGKATLLIANHFSWWDGFVLFYLNKIHFKKQFRIMVLEETMQQIKFFKYLGAFSVNKNSKQVIDSLNYAAGLLNDADSLVVIFPQGKLHSNFVDEIVFEKGVLKIAEMSTSDFQYLFAATFTESLQHKKPTANVSLKVIQSADLAPANVAQAYQQYYQSAKQNQMQKVV